MLVAVTLVADELDDELVVVVIIAVTVVVLDIVADEFEDELVIIVVTPMLEFVVDTVRVVPAARVVVVRAMEIVVSGATVVCEGRP